MNGTLENEGSAGPKIRRGMVDSINIYEITESELEVLENATPTGVLFDVGVACLSTAISFVVTLTTTTIPNDRMFYSYLIVCILGFIASVFFLIMWWAGRKSVKVVIRKIKDRIQIEVTENANIENESIERIP